MNPTRFLIAATASSIAAVTLVGVVSADKPPAIRAPAMPQRRAAPVLSAAARAARAKIALKSAGFSSAVLGNVGTRLTPIAPTHSSGAAITFAGPGILLGAAPGEPHGAFLLMQSSVKMRFPTTAGKIYVLTCRFEMFGSQPVTIARQGAANVSLPVDGGHILHAFQANGPNATVSLEVLPPNNFPSAGYFYGCDLDT